MDSSLGCDKWHPLVPNPQGTSPKGIRDVMKRFKDFFFPISGTDGCVHCPLFRQKGLRSSLQPHSPGSEYFGMPHCCQTQFEAWELGGFYSQCQNTAPQ